MAKKNDMVWVEGERELFLNMQRTMDGTMQKAMQGLEKAALNIIADAKENLKGNHSVVTGQLRASGRVQRVEGDEQAIDAGFFSEGSESGYAYFVEYGRRSGKMPPLFVIKQWVRKKFGVDAKEAKSIGFLIARKIAKKGTKPHPFFAPAVEKNKKQINEAITMAIQSEIK